MSFVSGGCYCRLITYRAENVDPRPVAVCHCRQCRQFAGYTWAATAIARDALEIQGAENLTWFQSSDHARRGFCRQCGSHLFWDETGNAALSIAAGSIDDETTLSLGKHIYVQDKPPYYSIPAEEL